MQYCGRGIHFRTFDTEYQFISLSYYKADVPQTCSYLLTIENQQFLNISLKGYVK